MQVLQVEKIRKFGFLLNKMMKYFPCVCFCTKTILNNFETFKQYLTKNTSRLAAPADSRTSFLSAGSFKFFSSFLQKIRPVLTENSRFYVLNLITFAVTETADPAFPMRKEREREGETVRYTAET